MSGEYEVVASRKTKRGKYNAKKKEVDGIIFDSKKEARFYVKLKRMQEEGLIKDLIVKPEYELQPRFEMKKVVVNPKGGFKEKKFIVRPIGFTPDFSFWDNTQNRYRVIDAKGFATKDYQMRKKLFDFQHLLDRIYIEEHI